MKLEEIIGGGVIGILATKIFEIIGKRMDAKRFKGKDSADTDKSNVENYRIQIESAVAMARMEREEKHEYRKENVELRKQLREAHDLLYNEKKKNADCERDLQHERNKHKPDGRAPDRNAPV